MHMRIGNSWFCLRSNLNPSNRKMTVFVHEELYFGYGRQACRTIPSGLFSQKGF